MVGFGLGVEGWSVKMMLVLVELRRVFDRRKGNSSVVYLLLHYGCAQHQLTFFPMDVIYSYSLGTISL
jgi:hypothetical protein